MGQNVGIYLTNNYTPIPRWVTDTGQKGAILTLVELEEEGEAHSWRGVSQDILVKALNTLEAERKAEVFQEGEGVKFF